MRSKIRILGIWYALSYMIVVLFTWIYSELFLGDTYFSAGEPNKIILYTEWILGIISISVLIYELKAKLDEKTQVIYDLPV